MSREHDDDGRNDRLAEEVAFHIEQHTEKLVRSGLPRDEARRRALLRFGGVEAMKESARDQWRFAWMRGFTTDLRHAVRGLLRAPAFAALVVATLGLGIAASTALFSVVRGVLLRELPYPDADRIVRMFQINTDGTPNGPVQRINGASELNVFDWRRRTRNFASIATMAQWGPQPVSTGRDAVTARLTMVSREFIDVMRVQPAAGRWFLDAEQREGAERAVVISESLSLRIFGGPAPPDARLRVGSDSYAIVGQMPPGFDYPGRTEVWMPAELRRPSQSRTAHNVQVVGRVSPGVGVEDAASELSLVSRQMRTEYGEDTWMVDATAVPLLEQTTSAVRPALRLLFGAAALMFLIACANAANLLLARVAARRQEAAIQMAMGAGRWRVIRQRLAEILILTAGAIAVGLAMARLAIAGMIALDPGTIARLKNVSLDWAAAGFAIAISLAATLAIGLVTSWRRGDRDLRTVLGEVPRGGSGGRSTERARQALVAGQVAITVILLAGTALLARSFVEVLRIDPGYRTDGITVIDLVVPSEGPGAEQRQRALQKTFVERLQTLPGVAGVGFINDLPAGGGNYANGRFLEMNSADELTTFESVAALGPRLSERAGYAAFRVASGDYFRVMQIPLLRGRLFEEGDTPDAPHVAVVSESLAKARWPDRDPIGRFVQFGNMDGDLRGFRIVGVVGDVREITPEAAPGPTFYADFRQRPGQAARASIVVDGGDATLASSAQRILRELAPDVPIQVRSLADVFDAALRGRRFNLVLIAVFALTALVLAVAGTYGLVSVLVAQRRREIGIRVALGADTRSVLSLVMWQATRLAAAGAAVGLAASLLMTRLVDGLLYRVEPSDPATLASAALIVTIAVMAASVPPAWRAASVAPTESLRR
jgi:predicted permease